MTITNATADHTSSIVLGGAGLGKLGLTANTYAPTSSTAATAQTLHVDAIGTNAAQDIQIGGTGGVKSLADLNTKLAASNLSASINSTGKVTFTTANDDASVDLTGKLSGSATGASGLFGVMSFAAPVADLNAQNLRASLVTQYNTVIDQIKTTAQDSSFNGINLLNGDQLKLVFNETGKSTLNISGVTDDPAGLGLASLTAGTDFLDNDGTNKVLSALNDASNTLAFAGVDVRCEPVDRADPSGLQQEPDQRAADRFVEPDAGRYQRGSGQQPGAVDPPVDRGVRAGARQPVAAERAPAAPLISATKPTVKAAGETPPLFSFGDRRHGGLGANSMLSKH